jgi:hypothetical protein
MAPPVGYRKVGRVKPPHVNITGGKLPTARRALVRTDSSVMDRHRSDAEYARGHVKGCVECRARLAKQITDRDRFEAWLRGAKVYTGARCACGSTGRRVRDGACWSCFKTARGSRKNLSYAEFSQRRGGYSLDSRVFHKAQAEKHEANAHICIGSHTAERDGFKVTGRKYGDERVTIRLDISRTVRSSGVFRREEYTAIDAPDYYRLNNPVADINHYGGDAGALAEVLSILKEKHA